jgi:D-glycero-alpha-D-manno-heptose-7-phosphate kinase
MLMLFYTGRHRAAGDVLSAQREAIREGGAVQALIAMRDLAYRLRDALGRGDIDSFGPILHENWELKRSLTDGVSGEMIDDYYGRAMQAGATGGKLLGAGGGGFLLVVASPERQASVRAALADLRETPFRFAARGTQIELFEPPNR